MRGNSLFGALSFCELPFNLPDGRNSNGRHVADRYINNPNPDSFCQ